MLRGNVRSLKSSYGESLNAPHNDVQSPETREIANAKQMCISLPPNKNVGLIIEPETLFIAVAAGKKAAKAISSNDLIKEVARILEGSGGGKPTFARGSGKNASLIPDAIKKFIAMITKSQKTKKK